MDTRKIIVTFHIVMGAIVWCLSRAALSDLYLRFYQIRRFPAINGIREALPVILGAVVFGVLMQHPKVNPTLEEVVSELKKVTWPTRDDVVKSTTVVLICILIASFILAGFDLVWGKVVTFLLKS